MSDRLAQLQTRLAEYTSRGVALAFSGGVDSSLLLAALAGMRRTREFAFCCCTAVTVFQRPEEEREARRLAEAFHTPIECFTVDPLEVPGVRSNPPDRCYLCKRAIFAEIAAIARRRKLGVLLDGTHAGDLTSYRPGRRALADFGVRSPLAELGFTKPDIRELAARLGLECAGKPASPCLATRFEYGMTLAPEWIVRIAAGEDAIRRILPRVRNVRLRVHASKIARIEVDREWLGAAAEHAGELAAALRELGFAHVTLDLAGFRSGSMDEGLPGQGVTV